MPILLFIYKTKNVILVKAEKPLSREEEGYPILQI
jgi:hypothetical protein